MVTIGVSGGYDVLTLSDDDLAKELDAWVRLGATWVRVDLDWSAIESSEGTFDWSDSERVVDAATGRGLKVLGLLAYSPLWATSDPGETHAPPSDVGDYATFCAAAATYYAGRIAAYELWNEPNITDFWTTGADPEVYTDMVQAAYPVIVAADPAATVIAGALSPAVTSGGDMDPETFTADCYTEGIQGYFHAWSVHPYCYPASPDDVSTYAWNTFQRLPLVYDAMDSGGDGDKKIWLTEWGAPTANAPGVTEAEQAAHHVSAVTMVDGWAWAGPLFLFSGRDRDEVTPTEYWTQYGVIREDWTYKPAWRALRAVLPRTALQTASGTWRVEIRDASLDVVGVCDVWTEFKAHLRHRRAGGWTLTLPAGHDQAALLAVGTGVIVWAPWSTDWPLLSGPVTGLTVTAPQADTPASLVAAGIDDTGLLADRLVLPDPTSALDDQDADAYWESTATAEELIRTLVDVNAGDSAISGRRICDADPEGRLDTPDALVGTSRSVSARFDNLLTLVGEIGATDNLALRVYQPTGTADLWLDVAESTDRSAQVRLSQSTGTLTSATATVAAPTATSVLVAGGGEGTDRVLVERVDTDLATEWGRRVEVFRDARDTTDTDELEERGDETLAESAATAGVSLEPVDLPGQGFGTHYQLGDTITVEVGDESWTDIVTEVDITVNAASGTVVVPVVGDADTGNQTTPAIYQRVRDLTRRLESLERRQ